MRVTIKKFRNYNDGKAGIILLLVVAAVVLILGAAVLFGRKDDTAGSSADSSAEVSSQVSAEEKNDSIPEPESNVSADSNTQSDSRLAVHFLDVGQGASTLLVCDGEAMLIDGGGEETSTAVQLYLKKQNIESLSYVVATHPDADHIGGLDVILYKFDCGKVLSPDTENDTAAYRNYLAAIDNKGLTETHPKVGDTFLLGSAECTVLGPIRAYDSGNDNSLVILVRHGEKKFLFPGDAEHTAERELAEQYPKIQADVYLAAHHGSKSSSYEEWLNVVEPKYTVISCGAGNRDGHPHTAALDRLAAAGTQLFRTDLQGTIVVESDGRELTFNCSPVNDFQPGQAGLTGTESEEESSEEQYQTAPEGAVYVGNIKNWKLHLASCDGLPQRRNQILVDTLEEATKLGFTEENQCKRCRPFSSLLTN